MTGLTVNLGERSYPIHISSGFDNIGKVVASIRPGKVLVVTDSNVERLHANSCIEEIRKEGLEVLKFVFPAGEVSKNLGTVKEIYSVCMENKFERKDTIVALGGGVAGDIAGFAAATYLRGVNFIQVPTSLIAQCDSSVGGKVGVDFEGGKNLIGSFYQPNAVFININTLKTLPEREYISGLAEVIKHSVIKDKDFFRYLEENTDEILNRRDEVLSYVIKINCSIKSKVVETDERENYLRAILNFGHTVGHAIESVLNFSLLHGECISLGIAAACSIARKMSIVSKQDTERIIALLSGMRLPVVYKNLDTEKVYNQMFFDKKISEGKLNFILPKRIGEVIQCNDIPKDVIKEAIKQLTVKAD